MKLAIKIVILIVVFKGVLLGTPFSQDAITKNQVNIVAFITSWCPVCQETEHFLQNLSNNEKTINISIIYVDEQKQQPLQNENLKYYTLGLEDSKVYGLDKSVPYILIIDKDEKVVKKYHTLNGALLSKLVKNLDKGIYENGTPPPSQRIDLWQNKRY